jgi:hypothetical protein
MREVAAGLSDPADIKAAEEYAKELERDVLKEHAPFIARKKRT